jgi:hypothetical protein
MCMVRKARALVKFWPDLRSGELDIRAGQVRATANLNRRGRSFVNDEFRVCFTRTVCAQWGSLDEGESDPIRKSDRADRAPTF